MLASVSFVSTEWFVMSCGGKSAKILLRSSTDLDCFIPTTLTFLLLKIIMPFHYMQGCRAILLDKDRNPKVHVECRHLMSPKSLACYS